jgi:hypothetical protein
VGSKGGNSSKAARIISVLTTFCRRQTVYLSGTRFALSVLVVPHVQHRQMQALERILGLKSRATPNKALLPKVFARSIIMIKPTTTPTNEINNNKNHQSSHFAICIITIILQMGIIDAQPGCPAFSNIFQNLTTIKITINNATNDIIVSIFLELPIKIMPT